MKKPSLILVGGGGHCKSCIDVIEALDSMKIKGILDLESKVGETLLDYPIIGTDELVPSLLKEHVLFLITAGDIGSPAKRIKLFNMIQIQGGIFATIISPTAYVSRHAKIGEGTIVMHHAMVNASSTIGRNCIINTKALIEHDAVVGEHCHISTGSIINGGTVIGPCSFFGSGAVSKQYITIPGNTFIKANSIVK